MKPHIWFPRLEAVRCVVCEALKTPAAVALGCQGRALAPEIPAPPKAPQPTMA